MCTVDVKYVLIFNFNFFNQYFLDLIYLHLTTFMPISKSIFLPAELYSCIIFLAFVQPDLSISGYGPVLFNTLPTQTFFIIFLKGGPLDAHQRAFLREPSYLLFRMD